jgi:hypothetical protein
MVISNITYIGRFLLYIFLYHAVLLVSFSPFLYRQQLEHTLINITV